MSNSLFYQLIRVAIGTQDSLSRLPSQKEWKALYDMAKKQALVGVCFAGLHRLRYDADESFARIGMSKKQYLTWMGMTAKIQQKNQTVDEQCAELQAKLSADGLRSCVLKGQGVASLYSEHLLGLRQSGDIDVWLDAQNKDVVEWAQKVGMTEKYMICAVDEKRGRMLLRQVMQTGNFGKMDKVQKEARSTTAGSVKYKLSQWWELLKFYPEETLSAPLWSVIRHFD